ncbi:MAG TPA: SIR2 family protein [Pyrinomonadaceae bacterium]|jgi:hypothetical protein|nr:SIR2 family protein [Pyrinomonadaceae bacterium]
MTNSEVLNASQPDGWDERDWKALLLSIKFKQCTPFLGAGACAGVLPLGRDVALTLAEEFDYPFADNTNLLRVAQYVAIEDGARTPKYKIIEQFADKGPPDFNDPNEPHRVVADLRLPVYITTNYDDFMMQALKRDIPQRTPQQEICKWYMARRRQQAAPEPILDPTPDKPLVFHLHGTLTNIESMVLTEDDYLDFLMFISEDQQLIPPRIEQAFTESSLLFMGYSLDDMNFKVLFRKLASYMQRNEGARHVSVQLAPKKPGQPTGEADDANAPEQKLTEAEIQELVKRAEKQRLYLQKHFGLQKVKVYWGKCEEFSAALRERWEAYK